MWIAIPGNARHIIEKLEENGFSGYCVGGSVRDSLMGKVPGDWDIATSARPEEVTGLFPEAKVVPTGIRHGTVTVILDKEPYEVTTFRVDGDYTDGRHPSAVAFTDDLVADLSRRDFTINAMAYSERTGLIDPFGAQEDLRAGILRTVGNPDSRFREDGLRIMRALRFSATLGFPLEEETAAAVRRNRELLQKISAERLAAELEKLVMGKDVFRVLMAYPEVLGVFLPEILPTVGFSQYGKKHAYTVWEHICHTVDAVPPDKILRLTMLLHDLGKVETHERDENGNSRFPGHAAVGGEMAREILTRLRFPGKTVQQVAFLVAHHDWELPESKTALKHFLSGVSPEDTERLLLIKTADRGALSEAYRDVSEEVTRTRAWLLEITKNHECCRKCDLAVNGADLQREKGLSGEAVGEALERLLDAVIDGKVANERAALLTYSV